MRMISNIYGNGPGKKKKKKRTNAQSLIISEMRIERALQKHGMTLDEFRKISNQQKSAPKKVPKKTRPVTHPDQKYISSDEFLSSYEWRRVRMIVLKRDGARCACCGSSPANGAVMNVDHIKPRRIFPQLALDISNLQVLCSECNHGKGNWDSTDWRQLNEAPDAFVLALDRIKTT